MPTVSAAAVSACLKQRAHARCGPTFHTLVFSRGVTSDGRPINPAAVLPSRGKELHATFEYVGMQNGMSWSQVWAVNGQQIVSKPDRWEAGSQGRRTLSLTNSQGLPDGEYHLVLTVGDRVMAEGTVMALVKMVEHRVCSRGNGRPDGLHSTDGAALLVAFLRRAALSGRAH